MRAARLLKIPLLLQNRGRLTSTTLAAGLAVTPHTILRDVDALSQAGLRIVVHRGNRGGIALGFTCCTRLTGLATDKAEALALWLATPPAPVAAVGLMPTA
ncbi:MAG: HTH domain-containing protein [Paracoccaceae bacterium]